MTRQVQPKPCTRLTKTGKPRHYWQRIQGERGYGFKRTTHRCWYCGETKQS